MDIPVLSSEGFDTLGDPRLVNMLAACNSLCDRMASGEDPIWLSLLGPSGSGKSHLANLVRDWVWSALRVYQGGQYLVTMTRDIMFVDAYEIVRRDADNNWNFVPRICEAFFVVVDDIGAPRDKTGHLADCYSRICNRRLGKWTLFTSNLLVDDIRDNVDARVASRMYRGGSIVVETNAPDFNLRAK